MWRQFVLPLLSSLARQSSNTSREIRHASLVHLQRILLGPHLPLDEGNHNQIEETFNRVIFPLLDELLKQQVFMRDPLGIPETRLRASALLCKAFMQFEARDGQIADIRVLWIQVLDLLDRLMHVDRRDQLVRDMLRVAFVHERNAQRKANRVCIHAVRGCARIAEERAAGHECHRAARPTQLARGRPERAPGCPVGRDAREDRAVPPGLLGRDNPCATT